MSSVNWTSIVSERSDDVGRLGKRGIEEFGNERSAGKALKSACLPHERGEKGCRNIRKGKIFKKITPEIMAELRKRAEK